jgi:hypothetical protein
MKIFWMSQLLMSTDGTLFWNHVYKIIILSTLVITIPSLEILLFCQHNLTGGGNLELRQTINLAHLFL